ncbi:MAG: hypothetical protein ACKO38_13725 [Planctomycetota bacterium]
MSAREVWRVEAGKGLSSRTPPGVELAGGTDERDREAFVTGASQRVSIALWVTLPRAPVELDRRRGVSAGENGDDFAGGDDAASLGMAAGMNRGEGIGATLAAGRDVVASIRTAVGSTAGN